MVEQLEKSDNAFNENIAKVGRSMDAIGNVMQQCVGILGNIAQTSNAYSNSEHFNIRNARYHAYNIGQNYNRENANLSEAFFEQQNNNLNGK